MQMTVAHAHSNEEIRARVDRASKEYGERYPHAKIDVSWSDETHADISFSVRGKAVAVAMTLETGRIAVHADVPFLFRPFEGMIRTRVEAEAAKWLT